MDYSESQMTYKIKFIMLGNSGVGKTSITHLVENPEKDFISVEPTLGYEFISKVYQCESDLVQVHLWDTAGQDKYANMSNQYFKRAAGALIVFDITSKKSFEGCKEWYSYLKDSGEDSVEILLIGNKVDLEEEREVSTKEAQEFARQNSFPYIETSVLMNKNIQEGFQILLNKIITKLKKLEHKSANSSTQHYTSFGLQREAYNSSIVLRKRAELLTSRDKSMESKSCKC
ncbi:unnamed protein product [Moneuplotes crassus]|uniref:Uncharacterized protein n=1 Tax=Euplotes crassus TaxID=5936 RepID=A0AAD1XMU4_EUPCR|nr:unnamed protein product [Moneuplotes crassus]